MSAARLRLLSTIILLACVEARADEAALSWRPSPLVPPGEVRRAFDKLRARQAALRARRQLLCAAPAPSASLAGGGPGREVLRIHSLDPALCLLLQAGTAFSQRGRGVEAIMVYQSYRRQDETSAASQKVVAALGDLVARFPDAQDPEVRQRIVDQYRDAAARSVDRTPEDAIDSYATAYLLGSATLFQQGQLHRRLGRLEDAALLLSRHLEEDPSSPLRGMVLNDLNDIIHRLGQRRGPPVWPFLVGAGAVALAVGLSVGLAPRSPAPQATIDPFSSR